jgi:CrcB protein
MVAQEEIVNPAVIAAVAVGGALGSVTRYLVAIGVGRAFGASFPWGIFFINVSGSALIGVFAGLFALRWNLPEAGRAFLTVGICGGYTTFSSFSLDTWYLIERGEAWAAFAYVTASVVLSIGALIGAMHLVRALSQAPMI